MQDLIKKIIQVIFIVLIGFILYCNISLFKISQLFFFIILFLILIILFILYKRNVIKPRYLLIISIILLILGSIIRIYYIKSLNFKLSSDFLHYYETAINIFNNGTLNVDKISYDAYVYIFSYIIGIVMKIFGESVNTILWFNLICQLITVFILYKINARFVKKELSFFMSIMWYLLPVTIFAGLLVSTETLFSLLLSLCIYFFLNIVNSKDKKRENILSYFLLGILLSFANYIRPSMLIFLVAILIYFILTNKVLKKYLLVLTIVFSFFTTGMVFNKIVENAIKTDTKSGSFAWSLYYGANYESCGGWIPEDGKTRNELLQYDNASELLLNATKERYEKLGLVKSFDHLKCKFSSVWKQNLGTFWFVSDLAINNAEVGLERDSYILSDFSKIIVNFLLLITFMASIYEFRKKIFSSLFVQLLGIGYILALLIICVNGRYSFPFYLLLPIISSIFLKNFFEDSYTNKSSAIVTDSLWRKSISVIRSLGKKDVNVTVLYDNILNTGIWSRYASNLYKTQTAANNYEEFGMNLLTLIEKYKEKPVLFPMEDASLIWCSKNIDKIKNKVYLLIPDYKSLEIAESKELTIKHAMKNKIPCPETFFPENYKELQQMIKNFNKPFIIKPHSGSGSSGIIYDDDINNYNLKEHWEKHGNLILQERIPSTGVGCGMSILMNNKSEVIAYFGHKRLEQYPNLGGPSTQRIGIKDKNLYDMSVKLLKSLNWKGIAMVEWKYNSEKDEMVLMEINPRFWGSLELAVRSGVDFPYLYYELSKGKKVKPIKSYNTNVICRWLVPGDILRYITKKDREPLGKFFKNILKSSEEWDKSDKRCFFASFICQALLVINPKYWKYIRR